jgi:hypothetical protein
MPRAHTFAIRLASIGLLLAQLGVAQSVVAQLVRQGSCAGCLDSCAAPAACCAGIDHGMPGPCRPCRCQWEPRGHGPVGMPSPASPQPIVADGALLGGLQRLLPVVSNTKPSGILFPPDRPERPVRILYGVWRD